MRNNTVQIIVLQEIECRGALGGAGSWGRSHAGSVGGQEGERSCGTCRWFPSCPCGLWDTFQADAGENTQDTTAREPAQEPARSPLLVRRLRTSLARWRLPPRMTSGVTQASKLRILALVNWEVMPTPRCEVSEQLSAPTTWQVSPCLRASPRIGWPLHRGRSPPCDPRQDNSCVWSIQIKVGRRGAAHGAITGRVRAETQSMPLAAFDDRCRFPRSWLAARDGDRPDQHELAPGIFPRQPVFQAYPDMSAG